MRLFPATALHSVQGFAGPRRKRALARERKLRRALKEKRRLERLRQENARLRNELRTPLEPEPEFPEVDDLQPEALGRALPWADPSWGPSVPLGQHLRVQAQKGHRAAVIGLKPGLYLVAELPETMTNPALGIVPLLAPMMITAAKKVLTGPHGKPAPVAPAAPPALPGPSVPAAAVVGWAEPVEVGCAHCGGRCGR